MGEAKKCLGKREGGGGSEKLPARGKYEFLQTSEKLVRPSGGKAGKEMTGRKGQRASLDKTVSAAEEEERTRLGNYTKLEGREITEACP